ncbi:MAG: hypothetical protein JSV90_08315 [Methanobacteriota archaeon]|nr:MAG: hypothetical protein JSV90_08315 [Euryarchaeota archaeon]
MEPDSGPSRVNRRRRPQPKKTYRLVAAGATATLIISLTYLAIALASGDDIPVGELLLLLLSITTLLAIRFEGRHQARMAQYLCYRGELGKPIATSRGAQRGPLVALPALPPAIIVALVLLEDTTFLYVAVGAAILITAILIIVAFSRVIIVRDGICAGVPSAPTMLRLPFEKISRITLKGRMLKVTMTEKISAVSPESFRYVVLGDARPIGATLQALALTRGADIAVENVEIDPKLLNASLTALSHSDEMAYVNERAADERELDEGLSYRPDVASVLLFVAGGAAILTALILLFLDEWIADEIGHHLTVLGCCYAVEFLFGALTIIGGFLCAKRKKYGYVRASAVIAILSFGGFVSTILGIIALILIIRSADEFRD